jgi:hypothetical protein
MGYAVIQSADTSADTSRYPKEEIEFHFWPKKQVICRLWRN